MTAVPTGERSPLSELLTATLAAELWALPNLTQAADDEFVFNR